MILGCKKIKSVTVSPVAYWTLSNLGEGLIFWCHIFLPVHTVHIRGVLSARILEWFSIPSSSGPWFVRTLHPSVWWPCVAWSIALLSYASPFTTQGCLSWRGPNCIGLVKNLGVSNPNPYEHFGQSNTNSGMMREGKIENINERVGLTAYSSEDNKQSRLMESKVCFMLDASYLGGGKR